MELSDTMFIQNLPAIDLHGYDRDSARVAINDFVRINYNLKNEKIVIVHGVGEGIIRKTTQEVLHKNKYVKEYAICYNNPGSTVVRLKFDK